MGQQGKPAKEKKHHFAFYAGVGPNYYFNNIVTFKQDVNSWNYSITGRFMWEPGSLLSVGLESGYYRLYTVNISQPSTAHVSTSAIPIQLVVSMKFLKDWYVNFNMGQSVLLNKAHADGYSDVNATVVSLGDFAASVGYKYKFPSRFSVGAEAKAYLSTKDNDFNVALLVVAGYNF
ncbi:MAG TPA: hypothetical protein VMI35_05300 [Puia sp.]|nr:hypothetical protein [Puia sp.]